MDYIKDILKQDLKNLSEEEDREFLRDLNQKKINKIEEDIFYKIKSFEDKITENYNYKEDIVYTVPFNEELYLLNKEDFFPLIQKENFKTKKEIHIKKNIQIKKVFLNKELSDVYQNKNKILNAEVKIGEKIFQIKVKMIFEEEYLNIEREMLKVKRLNNIDWEVPYTPYSRRFFNIILEEYPEEIEGKKVENVNIDYEDLSKSIKEDYYLYWNIENKEILVDKIKTELNLDDIFRFKIFSNTAKTDLIKIDEGKILKLNRHDNNIEIESTVRLDNSWKLWDIRKKLSLDRLDSLEFKPVSNKKQQGIVTNLKNRKKRNRSLLEIHEIFNRYEFTELKLLGTDINEYVENEYKYVDFNWAFRESETLKRMREDILTIRIKVTSNEIYTEDNISFILSVIAYEYPEYNVRGVIYKDA